MLKAGLVFLTAWSGLNLLLALGILAALSLFGQDAPALRILFEPAQIARLDANALATVNALAVFGNACAAGFCLLILFVVWTGLQAGSRRSLWALAVATVPVQAFGFVSDAFLGHRNLVANGVSTAVLLAGLVLSWAGLRSAGRAARVS